MKKSKTIDELRRLYVSLCTELHTNQEILSIKDEVKKKLTEKKLIRKTVIEVEEKENKNN